VVIGRLEAREVDLSAPQPSGRLNTTSTFRHISTPQRAIGAVTLLILCSILVAGLWPFHSPKNQVHWLENENGLHFGHYGTILSSGIFERASSDGPSCSLEVWVEPARTWGSGTILAFYRTLNHGQFSLQQSYIDLVLQRDIGDEHHHLKTAKIYVDDVFRKKQVFVTVTSDGQGTAVYIDGQLATRSPRFELSARDITGTLIGATSPLQSDSWSGQLRGLALYGSDLSAEQVAQHYGEWTRKGKPTFADGERALALYLFDERAGKIIHNRVGSGIDLYIPARYVVVHQTLLEPPWSEFRTQWGYLKNALINIGGFVPLGFSVYAYFSLVRRLRRPAVATVIVGAIVSVTIEVLQACLPTRDSGMTDLFTNTLGTCIGVLFCRAATPPLVQLSARRSQGAAHDLAEKS
jgi:VanZ like family/Concanavalin A-like lectin/glucanases superfamily